MADIKKLIRVNPKLVLVILLKNFKLNLYNFHNIGRENAIKRLCARKIPAGCASFFHTIA
ncbi:hypothetical protein SAMN04489724_2706 [Algoriphagus locisalis]|uniref:Uncharacterized protein n=1 Tax=Algoriphagus locisalis TaxID=305507 RepID=A0A1I7BTN5_9BACT|nr:hypothetical protein SAMN04489724_2706 [Algoriphagus locisalis]